MIGIVTKWWIPKFIFFLGKKDKPIWGWLKVLIRRVWIGAANISLKQQARLHAIASNWEYIFPAHIFKPRQFDDAFAILPMHTVAPNR